MTAQPIEGARDSLKSRQSWSVRHPGVKQAVHFARASGAVTPEQLVRWDDGHGRHLFTWNDAVAGSAWRLHQARLFLEHFRRFFNGYRVRAFISLPTGEDGERAYFPAEHIAETKKLRELVIADLVRRMANLAKELLVWRLSPRERLAVIRRLSDAISGQTTQR